MGVTWVIALSLACAGSGSEVGPRAELVALTVTLPSDSMHVGEAVRASLSGHDATGAPVAVPNPVWTSSAPTVATVSPQAVVTAVGLGLTRIVATAGGRTGEILLHVVPVPVSLVSLTPVSVTLAPGTTHQLSATALDAAGRVLPDRRISWLSSDTMRVAVSDDGMVMGVSPGLATVVAISEGAFASADIRVSGPAGPVASVTLLPAAASLTIGETLQLSTILEDAIGNVATDRPVAWASSAPAVATVSSSGHVTAVSAGSVMIEASSETHRGNASIAVLDPADAITVAFADPETGEVVGDTLAIYASASARNPIVRMHAHVLNKETELTELRVGFNGLRQAWQGRLDLRDVRYGPYQLVATAYDSKGNRGIGTVAFTRGARTGKGGTTIPPKNR